MNLLNLLVSFFFFFLLTLKINAKCNPIPFFPKAGDINSPIFLFNYETIQCQNRFVLTRTVKIHSAVIEMLSVSWFMLF